MSHSNRRYIVSVCHCVIGDISRRKIPFNYVPDDLVYNDYQYHNVRNNCRCNSGKLHYFGYIYCRRHLELIEWLFSHDACRQATEFSSHHRPGGATCSDGYNYYNFFYLADTIKICLRPDCTKDNLLDNLVWIIAAFTRGDKFFHVIFMSMIFVYIEICDFFEHCREIKNGHQIDGNQ